MMKLKILLAGSAALLASHSAHADFWNGDGDGFSWSDGDNWGANAVPDTGVSANINDPGANVTLSGVITQTPTDIGVVVNGSGARTATLTSSGTISNTGVINVAANPDEASAVYNATLTITGGSMTSAGSLQVGRVDDGGGSDLGSATGTFIIEVVNSSLVTLAGSAATNAGTVTIQGGSAGGSYASELNVTAATSCSPG